MKFSLLVSHVMVSLLLSGNAFAQPATPSAKTTLPKEMLDIYQAFKALHPYLNDRHRFTAETERETVKRLVRDLKSSFHDADTVDQRYMKQPGFNATLKRSRELLEDAERRLDEGKLPYAFWRLRTLERKCIVCHVTYDAGIAFDDSSAVVRNMTSYEQGEFFLASRQFGRAEEAFLAVLRQTDPNRSHMEALRQWLIIQARVKNDPNRSSLMLREAVEGAVLSEEDREEIVQWLRALHHWGIEKEPPQSVSQIEQMIHRAISSTAVERRADAVTLLRATSLLHQALERVNLEGRDRSRALYLLGYSYSHLPLYFTEDLELDYLKQAVEEFPGSEDARRSFELYKEQIDLSFTGSGGTRLPDDVELELKELERKARGIPRFEGKV